MTDRKAETDADARDVYRELRQHLDILPVGFPPTKSGVEMRILKSLFTPEEAQIATKLGPSYEDVEQIHERMEDAGIRIEELERVLDGMVSKGCINCRRRGNKKYYANAPLIVGIYEYQVKRLTPEFFREVARYSREAFGFELFSTKISHFRTVPMEKGITPRHYVPRYEELASIVKDIKDPIMVTECLCRKGMSLVNVPCKKTSRSETCIAFGDMAHLYIDRGCGRQINNEECLEILRRNEEDGLVLQAGNSERPEFICSCCGCCCGTLYGLKSMPNPVEFASSNYRAEVDPELCTGCGTCVDRCQINALATVDNVSNPNPKRCIGCGLCVPTCQSEAIHLVKKEPAIEFPKTQEDLMAKIRDKKIEIKQRRSTAKT